MVAKRCHSVPQQRTFFDENKAKHLAKGMPFDENQTKISCRHHLTVIFEGKHRAKVKKKRDEKNL